MFLTVLHRLFAPGSDRAAERWRRNYALWEAVCHNEEQARKDQADREAILSKLRD